MKTTLVNLDLKGQINLPQSFFTGDFNIFHLSVSELRLLLYFINDLQTQNRCGIATEVINIKDRTAKRTLLNRLFNNNNDRIVSSILSVANLFGRYSDFTECTRYNNELREMHKTKAREFRVYRDRQRIGTIMKADEFARFMRGNEWKDGSRYFPLSYGDLRYVLEADLTVTDARLLLFCVANRYRSINNGTVVERTTDLIQKINLPSKKHINITDNLKRLNGSPFLLDYSVSGRGANQTISFRLSDRGKGLIH